VCHIVQSHFLGQNFAKAFDVKYLNSENKEEYVWATSWGVSTRLVGGLIMTHSDDEGLVLPPRLAPIQVVIVPIPKPDPAIMEVADRLAAELKAKGIRIKVDCDAKKRPGFKFAEYEMKGIPARIGIGKRDLEKGMVEIARRDTKEKESIALENCVEHVYELMEIIQANLLDRAKKFREDRTTTVDSFDEFKKALEENQGFIYAHWDGTIETENKIKDETKASIRCIPVDAPEEDGVCVYSGKPSKRRVLFAKAY